jgi:hypothetical protein
MTAVRGTRQDRRRCMPDSFGKRQRDQVKARKAAARDERRVARNKRRKGIAPAEQGGDAALGMHALLDWNEDPTSPEETPEREAPTPGAPA